MITIYRCPDCDHKHLDHAIQQGSSCSMGGCRCARSEDSVKSAGAKEQIPTFPGYDATTGKWASR